MATKVKVTKKPEARWEEGVDHDERSVDLYKFMEAYDWKHNGDSLQLHSGGDGDIGEELMYLMDEYFAARDHYERNGEIA